MEHNAKTCPVCAGEKFEWGILRSTTYRSGLGVIGGGTKAVKVQRCLTCNHVLLFTDDAITRRDQLFGFLGFTLKLAVPILAIVMIARPIMNLVNGVRNFSQQTMQVKNQLDTISQQIEATSNRFTFPQFPTGNHKPKQDKVA